MAVSPETKQSERGETLWPILSKYGLSYLRAIDAEALILKEGIRLAPVESTNASDLNEFGAVRQPSYLEMLTKGDYRAHDLYGEFDYL